ncbi:MAG: hypothetical protein LKE47_11895 [Prevotella sp.]|jgi:hypothetical protein|nr:hypothetical protein [Prevotella sp.]MCH3971041.1 hypothetical protein [Prevotella sp.]MCH4099578.1 hypothetical protein [Prevotella sp.]MCI1324598.1 hypothetical protein [Prevotella sp.]
MNQNLKFSWGHIIGFLTMIFIMYVSFMGITYLTDGNFLRAGVGALVIALVLFLFFIGAQYMKGTDRKFARSIKWERFLLGVSPAIFIVVMIPYFHFWTVFANRQKITQGFSNAVNLAGNLFKDYDAYAQDRIDNYQLLLDRVVANKSIRPKEYREIGFTGRNDEAQKKILIKELKLQLLSQNYDGLKTSALHWIGSANGATVWNIFILGNIKQIKSSLTSWSADLSRFASIRIRTEEFHGYNTVKSFSPDNSAVGDAENTLNGLSSYYTKMVFPNGTALITSVFCYFLLLFPYFIQRRNTKSTYRFWGSGSRDEDTSFEFDVADSQEQTQVDDSAEDTDDTPSDENDDIQALRQKPRQGLHGRFRIEDENNN